MSAPDRPLDGPRPGRASPKRLLALAVSSLLAIGLAEAWARGTYRPVLELDGEFLGTQTYPNQRNEFGFREGALTAEILGDPDASHPGPRRLLHLRLRGRGSRACASRTSWRRSLAPGVHLLQRRDPRVAPFGVGARRAPASCPATARTTSSRFSSCATALRSARRCTSTGRGSKRSGPFTARAGCIAGATWRGASSTGVSSRTSRTGTSASSGPRTWARTWSDARGRPCRTSSSPSATSSTSRARRFASSSSPCCSRCATIRSTTSRPRFSEFASENGIPASSLIEVFAGHDERDLWVSAIDQHPNPAGHRIAADGLLPLLRPLVGR